MKQFQGAKRLTSDGVAGPLTLNALFSGVQLAVTIKVRLRTPVARLSVRGGPPAPAQPTAPKPAFTPFIIDPRDAQWFAQVLAWREWVARPIPKGPAPPLPSTAPPSLRLPSNGLSVPLLPSQRLSVSETPPSGSASAPVPVTGGNFETSIASGFKSGKLKQQEFKFKLDFAKATGLIDSDVVQHEVEGGTNDKGDLEVEQKVVVQPFKLFGSESTLGAIKVATLLITSVNSSLEASQFAGVKGVVAFRPFGRGFEVEVGGKLGPKIKLGHDEDGRATTTVYPLAGEGDLDLKFHL